MIEEFFENNMRPPNMVFLNKEDYLELQLDLNKQFRIVFDNDATIFEVVTMHGIQLKIIQADIKDSVIAQTIKINK
jgi:hypothetical protein